MSTKIINKNQYDHYVTCLRGMIYTIAKLKWEHKIWIHMNMVVSQLLYIYVISLNNMAFNNNHEKNMLKLNNLKACKQIRS